MTTATVKLSKKMKWLFGPPRGALRYRGAYGGRGSGKSFTFAMMSAIYGYAEPLRILCTREYQNSVRDSFHAEVKSAIQSTPWLDAAYDCGVDYIKGKNGTEYIFKGLRNNVDSVKSLAQIDICIIEEAESIPDFAWKKLRPSIRSTKSEIWPIWNPEKKGSPTDLIFRQGEPMRCRVVNVNWRDNPWLPSVLNDERIGDMARMNNEDYQWIWEGAYLEHSDAQIFKGRYVTGTFTPKHDWDGPYLGVDFGFSQDPTVAVKCWVYNNTLYIEKACGKVGLELDATAPFILRTIDDAGKYKVTADSARPESISFLRRNGLGGMVGAKKGKGSIEDGIEHIKSYDRIVIHPDCDSVKNEFDLYSFKKDRLTGDITTTIIDADNHYIDAIRYALEPIMLKPQWDYGSLL